MEPVTITITDPYELGGWHRVRCHSLSCSIRNLADEADLGNIVDAAEVERLPELLRQLDAALEALEAIHGVA